MAVKCVLVEQDSAAVNISSVASAAKMHELLVLSGTL